MMPEAKQSSLSSDIHTQKPMCAHTPENPL